MKTLSLRLLWLAGRRLVSRPGLSLLSLLSIVLTVGLVVSIPVFSQGVSYLLLREELANLANAYRRPPLTTRLYFLPRQQSQPLDLQGALALGEQFYAMIVEGMGLPAAQTATYVASPGLSLQPLAQETRYPEAKDNVIDENLTLSIMTGVREHLAIVEGAPFGQSSPSEALAVWVHGELAGEMGLQVGETYQLVDGRSENQIPVVIAGVWQEGDRADPFWAATTILWRKVLLVTEEAYTRTVQPHFALGSGMVAWYAVPDDSSLTLTRADGAARGLALVPSLADRLLPGVRMDVSPEFPLQRYVQRKASLSALLVGFSLPVLSLLLFFMWLLATVTARFQREEIAILAGRGTSRGFLMGMSVLEALLLVGLGTPLGLGLGYFMARLMGATSAFLSFTPRGEFPSSLLELDPRTLGLALVVLTLARLIPTLGAARAGIVHHLRQRSRPRGLGAWLKAAIDIPLVVITLYAYQQLRQRGTLGIIGWEPSGDPFRDPLLLLTPSLFVFTCALVLTHLFPVLVYPLDRLGATARSFAAFMGLRRLRREGGQYAGPLFLVVVCLSLGAFYASMALSLDQWLEERIYYEIGADYRFRQGIPPPVMGGPMFDEAPDPEVISAWLLPVSDYLEIPGVEAATRIGEFPADPQVTRGQEGTLLAVDRLDFPRVAYFRPDFAPFALGEFMNRLGMVPEGLLVSSRFMARHRMVEGQRLTLEVDFGPGSLEQEFLIVGVYDYFPTVYPNDREVFIGNLDFLFNRAGDEGLHQIWMRTRPGSDVAAVESTLIEMGIWPVERRDARARIVLDEERVERIGLFGVLSVGFAATAVLAFLGLLVFTYASLQGRLQQISVLRAVGIGTRRVVAMVGIEYLGVILYGVAAGTLVGIATAYLFVPFFRISGDPVFALPPFQRHIAWRQIGWLSSTFALALVLSQIVILHGATRRDIFQVLRMGQRE